MSMTECIERAITDMGHTMEIFDWYKFIIPGRLRERISFLNSWDVKRINRDLIQQVKRFKPDMLLVAGGFTIYPKTILAIRSLVNVVTVNWIADYPRNFDFHLKAGPYYDYFFTSGTDALEKYREAGNKNGYWLPFACHPEIHKPLTLTEEEKEKYGTDICFVGSNYPERIEILEKLSDFDFGIWGIGWEKLQKDSPLKRLIRGGIVGPDEWVKIFNASKIVLNITPRKLLIKEAYIDEMDEKDFRMCNTRVFEILGCGAFQLIDAKADAMTLFEDRKHLVFYKNVDELINLAKLYLHNPEERKRIAENGRQIALEKHTYKHRIEEILSIIGQNDKYKQII